MNEIDRYIATKHPSFRGILSAEPVRRLLDEAIANDWGPDEMRAGLAGVVDGWRSEADPKKVIQVVDRIARLFRGVEAQPPTGKGTP